MQSISAKNKISVKDRLKGINYGKACACVALLVFMGLMLANPTYYLNSAQRGLVLFATSVLPSLFPFYFCSLLLTYMGAVKVISALGARPIRFLYNTPKESAYILMLSMLCGYPVGASTSAELYGANMLSSDDVKSISAFASTSGPVFILGTVGSAIFSNKSVGWIILCSHYLASLINGLIYRKRTRAFSGVRSMQYQTDVDNLLAQVISKSTLNMLYVGGYIVICGMLIDTLELIGLRNALSAVLNADAAQGVISAIYGLIEMTRGSIECAKCANLHLALPLCCAIITLGGLSITLQNYTFLSKCNMRMSQILLRKLTQSIIAALISFALSFAL